MKIKWGRLVVTVASICVVFLVVVSYGIAFSETKAADIYASNELSEVSDTLDSKSLSSDEPGVIQSAWENFSDRFYKNFIKDHRYMWLVRGLWVTIRITIGSTILGFLIGTVLAIIKTIQNSGKRVGPLGFIVDTYLTVIRGTPVMVQLLIIYFVVFASSSPNTILIAILAFGINSGAYVAEIIRAGIEAVDKGQMEAGRSLGFSYASTMQLIVIPQAIKNVLPAMFNELITLLKETSIAGYIAIDDLTRAGLQIRNKTYEPFMPLLAIALIYLVIVVILTALMKKLERRLKQSDN